MFNDASLLDSETLQEKKYNNWLHHVHYNNFIAIYNITIQNHLVQ